MGVPEFLALLRDGGIIALLFAVLLGGWKRIWVWGWQLEAAEAREKDYREIAKGVTAAAESIAEIAERLEKRR